MSKQIWLEAYSSQNRLWIVLPTLIFAVCSIAYLPGLSGPLFFDDVPNLTANPHLTFSAGEFDAWRTAILSNDAGILLRPLSMVTFAVNSALAGGLDAYSLKLVNLGIHLLLGMILYALFISLLKAPACAGLKLDEILVKQIALFAAALWLLHPLHVSTVLYAVQRMAQLSALFTCAALLVYTRYRIRWVHSGATTGELIAASMWVLLLAVLAVFSKENGALIPWLIVVVEVFLFQGVWNGTGNRALRVAGWLLLILPFLL